MDAVLEFVAKEKWLSSGSFEGSEREASLRSEALSARHEDGSTQICPFAEGGARWSA